MRGPALSDRAAIAALWADPSVTRHILPEPLDADGAFARLTASAGHWALMGFGFFVVEMGGAVIGEVGVKVRTPGKMPHAGWVLAPSAHGQGLGGEAMDAALAWFDAAHGPAPLACLIAPDNAASFRLAARLGFLPDAQIIDRGEPVHRLVRAAQRS
ncbi:MAG: GNAT family N-acetyltransferase [Pseudomonadota bacterium]